MSIWLIKASSSGILLLLLIIFEHIRKDLFSKKQRYSILKASLFLLFIPIHYIKIGAVFILQFIFGTSSFISVNGKNPVIMHTINGDYMNAVYQHHQYFIYIWISVCVIICLFHLIRYYYTKKQLICLVKKPANDKILQVLMECKTLLDVKKKVCVYITPLSITPFTFGIWKPVIILPEFQDKNAVRMILLHELTHIKNNDCFIRFVKAVATSVYWFNPLVYLLNIRLEIAAELACDEAVIKNFSLDECKQYGYYMIDAATQDTYLKSYVSPFNNHKQNLQERLYFIMNKRKKTRFIAGILSFGMLISSTSVAFAYEIPQSIEYNQVLEKQDPRLIQDNENTSIFFGTQEQIDGVFGQSYQIVFCSQFNDKDGKVYPINELQEYKSCSHNYVDGTYSTHTKNSDGSCLVRYYAAKRCSKCGTLQVGEQISESTFKKCPHNIKSEIE